MISNATTTRAHIRDAAIPALPLQKTQQGIAWPKWLRWETLVVAGREVKGFVVPGWAAAVLLAAVVGAFGFMYNQNQAQREMLIRLDERLIERNDRDRERQEALEKWKQNADAIQIVLRRDIAKLEAQQSQKGNGNNH